MMVFDKYSASFAGSRTVNEDYCLEKITDKCAVFVLADGLGGHSNGEVASRLVCEHICAKAERNDGKGFLANAIESAQKHLLEEQKKYSSDDTMKTTVVALYIDQGDGRCSFAHSGDSRLYVIRKNKIVSRTLDHSVPQTMALSGEIKDSEIRHHPDRGKLLKAMGNEWDEESPQYEIDADGIPLKDSDAFLLCSDGFWEWITEKEIGKILKKKLPAEQTVQEMLKVVDANAAGSAMDNYTVMFLRIKEI